MLSGRGWVILLNMQTTSNPVLSKLTRPAKSAPQPIPGSGVATGTLAPPTGQPISTQPVWTQPVADEPAVTMGDIMTKCFIVFGVCVVFAFVGWFIPLLLIVGAIGALVLGIVNAVKRKVSPVLVLLYAVCSGLMLGSVSYMYDEYVVNPEYTGLVLQAVIGTMTAFGVMLVLYTTKIVKVTARFMRVFIGAMISYALIAFVSLIASFFGVGGGWGFYGVGGWGLLLCVFGVALACFSLMLDFEAISQAVKMGVPQREAWRLAFGLLITLVWLYLEILRLLAIVNRN